MRDKRLNTLRTPPPHLICVTYSGHGFLSIACCQETGQATEIDEGTSKELGYKSTLNLTEAMTTNVCPNCTAEREPTATACHRCDEQFSQAVEPPTHVPNEVPTEDLIRGFVLAPALTWIAIVFLREGKATLSFSRNAKYAIEVTGPWSSLLGALAMLMGAAAFGALVADHFDKRPNEHVYKRVVNACFLGFAACFLLAWFVGSKWEQVQWVTVK
jgi:hypothetical protein